MEATRYYIIKESGNIWLYWTGSDWKKRNTNAETYGYVEGCDKAKILRKQFKGELICCVPVDFNKDIR